MKRFITTFIVAAFLLPLGAQAGCTALSQKSDETGIIAPKSKSTAKCGKSVTLVLKNAQLEEGLTSGNFTLFSTTDDDGTVCIASITGPGVNGAADGEIGQIREEALVADGFCKAGVFLQVVKKGVVVDLLTTSEIR